MTRKRFFHNKLISWLQKRCNCGKFLSSKQLKYCKDCSKKIRFIKHKEDRRRFRIRHRKEIRIKDRERYYKEKYINHNPYI